MGLFGGGGGIGGMFQKSGSWLGTVLNFKQKRDNDKKKTPVNVTKTFISPSTESPAYTQALEAERRKRAVLAAQDPNYQGSGRTLLGGGTSGGKTLLGQ
jgi:hypothetical protein